MLNTILLAIRAAGLVGLNILLIIHMIDMKKAFDKVFDAVQQLPKKS